MNDSDSDTAMIQWIDMVRASVACATIGRARMVTLALQVFNQPSRSPIQIRGRCRCPARNRQFCIAKAILLRRNLFLSEEWYWMYSKICDSEILRPRVFRNSTHFPAVEKPCPHLDAALVPTEWRLAPLGVFGSRNFVTKSDLWEFLI